MEFIGSLLSYFIEFILNMDTHLTEWSYILGPWMYVLTFAVIFCETGLIIMPFLPGDSFLFALGALCAVEGAYLQLPWLIVLLCIAAILGDYVNYSVGRYFGEKLLSSKWGKYINPEHILKTQEFYNKHGGKTIVLARFLPIARTFAPFVAGMAKMPYKDFGIYNIFGGLTWVISFLVLGYFFGNLPAVKTNFHYVILGIIVLSVLPIFIELLKAKRTKTSP